MELFITTKRQALVLQRADAEFVKGKPVLGRLSKIQLNQLKKDAARIQEHLPELVRRIDIELQTRPLGRKEHA